MPVQTNGTASSRPSYCVRPYSFEVFKDLLAGIYHPDDQQAYQAKRQAIDNKPHCRLFEEYLDEIGIQTIVIEHEYVDRDFLDDYSAYYVRCFSDYPRTCTRLHFFNVQFESARFASILSKSVSDEEMEAFKNAYRGFIVVKPLPETVVGRTCLHLYDAEGGRRNYPCTLDYKVNLFGIPLRVTSLAFQEQDRVVAACATSSLWSVLQYTADLFHHTIPSPVMITKTATHNSPRFGRDFPNDGLTVEEMANAIRGVGLDPVYIGFPSVYDKNYSADTAKENFLNSLYAYVKGGIPCVLGFALLEPDCTELESGEVESEQEDVTDTLEEDGTPSVYKEVYENMHAVGVTGYRIELDKLSTIDTEFKTVALCMTEIYAHDDQVGPFARFRLDGKTIRIISEQKGKTRNIEQAEAGLQPTEYYTFESPWRSMGEDKRFLRGLPDTSTIPLYHKIRIPFEVIYEGMRLFNRILKKVPFRETQSLVWDIYITTNAKLKESIRNDDKLSINQRIDLVTHRMPRFIWRATATSDETKMLDLFFDATGIQQEQLLVYFIEHDEALGSIIREYADFDDIEDIIIEEDYPSQAPGAAQFVIRMLNKYRKLACEMQGMYADAHGQ